jgi:hypothetical protein
MRTRTRILLAGLVLGAALIGGVAWATIPGDGGVYTACKLNTLGTIRLIDPSGASTSLLSHCTSLETQITWNQRGPAGAAGAAGTAGAKGDPGPGVIVAQVAEGGSPLQIFDSPSSLGKLEAVAPHEACWWTLTNTTTHQLTVDWRFLGGSLSGGSFTVEPGELHSNQGAVGNQVVKVTDGTDTKVVWLEGSKFGSLCAFFAATSS